MQLYERKNYSNAKYDAQLNLEGRTHYVDDDALRFHYAKILETCVHGNGLIFSLIESCALDIHNTQRGFRYVIFDLFGHVIARPDLEACFKTSLQARKALFEALNAFNAEKVTREGLERWEDGIPREKAYIMRQIDKALEAGKAAA